VLYQDAYVFNVFNVFNVFFLLLSFTFLGRGAGTEAIVDLIGHRDANVIPIGAFYHGEARLNYFAKLITDTNIVVKVSTIFFFFFKSLSFCLN
jgi:hypothetical protein